MSEPRYAFFKGKIVPLEEAKVSVMTHALNYGTGCFEGIRAYWNEEEQELFVFRMKEHYERMLKNAHMLMMKLPYSADDLCDITLELLKKGGHQKDTYIRPLAYKSQELVGAIRLHEVEDDLTIFCITLDKYIDRPKGCHVGTSSWRRIDDTALPARTKVTGAYVNSALIKSESLLNGFDEAIVLNQDGHISEGSAENIFMIRDKELITSPVFANILEGITRSTVMQIAKEQLGLNVVERQMDRTEVYMADEVFFCGTGVEIVPIAKIDHRSIGNGAVGPITEKIKNLYFRTVRGQQPEYRHWCAPVYQKTVQNI